MFCRVCSFISQQRAIILSNSCSNSWRIHVRSFPCITVCSRQRSALESYTRRAVLPFYAASLLSGSTIHATSTISSSTRINSWHLFVGPHVTMRHPNGAFIALIALCPALISALPSFSTCDRPAPWRRLTNRILSSIWRTSDHETAVNPRINPITEARAGHSSSLAARYGLDIVLRFNISTAEEANAIAEASEDLYLDVWEFNDNWVDIRLAKDVVCHAPFMTLHRLTPL